MALFNRECELPESDLVARSERIGLFGESSAHNQLLQELAKLAATDIEVLIEGETGTGKELYAHFVHEVSGRSGAFIPVTCGALPDLLFENELFGHAAGAFTGATARSEGLVNAAEGGTLFLDEIHTLTPAAQVKLLRLLQEREYRQVGDTRIRIAHVRFVAATNQLLHEAVKSQRFRKDLYFRLGVATVEVAPLRDRINDIDALLTVFNHQYSKRYGLPAVELSQAAWETLHNYQWPGNIRELENCVRRLISRQLGCLIQPEDLALLSEGLRCPRSLATSKDMTPDESILDLPFREAKRAAIQRFERAYLYAALKRASGNITRAAKLSHKARRAFFQLMRKHEICADNFRPKELSNGRPHSD